MVSGVFSVSAFNSEQGIAENQSQLTKTQKEIQIAEPRENKVKLKTQMRTIFKN